MSADIVKTLRDRCLIRHGTSERLLACVDCRAADEITRLRAENEDFRGIIKEYESDPDYARSRFWEIDLLKDQRAHDRLKIQGLRARVEELEGALGDLLKGDYTTYSGGECMIVTEQGIRSYARHVLTSQEREDG